MLAPSTRKFCTTAFTAKKMSSARMTVSASSRPTLRRAAAAWLRRRFFWIASYG